MSEELENVSAALGTKPRGRPPTKKESAPAFENETPVDPMASMREEIAFLREQVAGIASPTSGKTRRKHTKEHTARLREYAEVDEDGNMVVKGIVTKLYNARQVKDPTGDKRYAGRCTLDVINPKTGKTWTVRDVDWIPFLQNATRVLCKITETESQEVQMLDKREGGGGTQISDRYDAEGRFISSVETDYYVTRVDYMYTLLIDEGEYRGEYIKNDGAGINL